MSNVINLRLNLAKVDKTRLFTGEKGIYLDVALIPTPDSQYQDFMAVESVTKDERAAGRRGTILGGGKYLKAKVDKESLPQGDSNSQSFSEPPTTDDLPF